MKIKKNNIIHGAVYIFVYTLLVLLMTRFKFAYGSSLDWSAQHYAIPDYFRKLFYDTGDLFPSFAFNIGAGENIYDLSYYGLYSPIILFSYLLPFVKMSVYIQVTAYLGVIISTLIFYRWCLKKFSDNLSFLLGLIFLFSLPLIFHSHRHIMFIGYMPFLLLSLMAVEDYFAGKKKYKLVLFPFFMIMCCYFYAISGLLSVTVYGVYYYLKITEKIKLKEFVNAALKFAFRLVTAVCMSAVLLAPTFSCMLSGRDKNNSKPFSFKELLPSARLNTFMFHTYSMGLGVFVIVAIISAVIAKDKHRRFLGVAFSVIALFPVVILALNGFLYFDAKVMIPFLPIAILMMGDTYIEIIDGKFKYKTVLPICVIYVILGLIVGKTYHYTLKCVAVDTILLLLCFAAYAYKKSKPFIHFSMLGLLVVSSLFANFGDKLTPLKIMNSIQGEDIQSLAAYAGEHNEFVRTGNGAFPKDTANMVYNIDYLSSNIYSSLHNRGYNDFYFNKIHNENAYRNSALTVESDNVLFKMYMSEKYLILPNEKEAPQGYEAVKTQGNYTLYENDKALPLGYASSNVISEDEFQKIKYPFSSEALLKYTIVQNGGSKYQPGEAKMFFTFGLKPNEFITYKKNCYEINAQDDIQYRCNLIEPLKKGSIMFIRFDVENEVDSNVDINKGDAQVVINGIKNKLSNPGWKYYNNNTSFEYTVTTGAKDSISYLDIEFKKGHYKLSNIECTVMEYPDVNGEVDAFEADMSKTKGDFIFGSIDVTQDGYFNISIPYNEGFTAKVDGKEVKCEKVDTAFLGFKISKGHHDIEIKYEAPMLKQGMVLSAIGTMLFIGQLLFELITKKKKFG